MSDAPRTAPVALIVFNRPDETRRVFESVRAAAPERLFVIADGPRHERDARLVDEVRAIVTAVDWRCDVRYLFAERNMGCTLRVTTGLDEVFREVESAIVLEDDCLPHPTYFSFCTELLQHYRDEPQVMAICGSNFQDGQRRGDGSYYFSRYNHIWGWATWRRAWTCYDREMLEWPVVRDSGQVDEWFPDQREALFWRDLFQQAYEGRFRSWDPQWAFAMWRCGGVAILPQRNLVTNIGFGATATRTHAAPRGAPADAWAAEPLRHPTSRQADRDADAYTFAHHFAPPLPALPTWRSTLRESAVGRWLRRLKHRVARAGGGEAERPAPCWRDVEQFDEGWRVRLSAIARWVPAGTSVLDLGCGKQWLREALPSCRYLPVDYVARSPDTIVCDFNRGDFPAEVADVAVVSGCLEYLEDPAWFVERISRVAGRCVISYNSIEQFPDVAFRRRMAWVNDLDCAALVALFERFGMHRIASEFVAGEHQIHVFERPRGSHPRPGTP